MKKNILLIFLLSSILGFSQNYQNLAPWMQKQELKKKSKTTLDDISELAKSYFNTIDENKKGSGLKPFERWKYHWSFYTKKDGTIAPAKDLWRAWEQKNSMNSNKTSTDVSNWNAIGPFNNSNTYSATNMQQTGQGRVNAIAVDPNDNNIIYVGSPAGGIWKSIDKGINWEPLTDHLPQIGVSGIAINPSDSNTIYIATGDDDASDSYSVGVWKSTDGGKNWSNTGVLEGNPNSMNEIFIYPTNNNKLLVATSSGVHMSTDAGTTWVKKLNGSIIDLKMKPGDPTTWYACSSSTFFKSNDSGETFSSITLPRMRSSTRLTIDVTIANPEYVYVLSAGSGSSFNGLWKSTNSGVDFEKTKETDDIFQSTQAWYDFALTVSSNNADIVYVGVLDIWKSVDGGDDFAKLNDWADPNTSSYTHADIHFMRFIDGKFYAGTDGGIYVSEDEGINFKDLTKNLAISQFYTVSVSPTNYKNVVGGLQDNGGFALNSDEWRNYHGGDGMEGIVDPTNENIHYGFIQYGGNLYKTTNGGRSNTFVSSAPSNETGTGDSGGEWVTPMVSNSKGEIYAGYKELYKLESGSWVKQSSLSLSGDLDHIEIDPKNDNNIYMSESGDLYRSTDEGKTFVKLPFTNGNIVNIEASSTNENNIWIVTNSRIYKSENILSNVPTFTDITSNLPTENKLVVKHHERSGKNTLYLGTTLGVYSYDESLSTWEVFDNNLPNVAIRDLEINEEDSKLFAATFGRGMFITDIPSQLPENDIRLLSINQIPDGIDCNTNLAPMLNVKNQGTNNVGEITVNFSFDKGEEKTFLWNGTLIPNATVDINLPTTNSIPGNHTLDVEVVINNDTYSTNNSLSKNFILNKFNATPTVLNTFENVEDELLIETTAGTMWELGTPFKSLLPKATSGSKSYATKLVRNHPDATTGYLYTNCYDLSSISDPVLAFKMAFDIELEWDYLVIEQSTNNGASWEILGTANDPNWYNSSATTDSTMDSNLPGKQWTGLGETASPLGGTNATFHDYSYDLSAFKNEKNIVFRFKFVADAAVNEEGVIIDDLVIDGVLSIENERLQNIVSVYPNPSHTTFNLSWLESGNASLTVHDYTGKLIFKKENIIDNHYKLNLDGYSKGLYIAKININNKQAIKKLILE